jgi:small GTP-binding protein
MKQFLASLGSNYALETAVSGNEALEKMKTNLWDMVITDNRMPGITGLELIETIKQQSPSTLVVLMTAYGSDEVEQATQRLGVYQYMIKPFPMTDLKRVIIDALPIAQEETAEAQSAQTEEIPSLKVVLAGDGFVGKTTMIKRLCTGQFDASRRMTIGVDFHLHDIHSDKFSSRLVVWDVSGQDHFAFTRLAFYRGSKAAGLVYSVDNRQSFERLGQWRKEIHDILPTIPLIIVGNKTDLERQVSTEEGAALAKEWNVPFFETSCVSGTSIEDFFITLSKTAARYAAR